MSAKILTEWYLKKAYNMKMVIKPKKYLFTRH